MKTFTVFFVVLFVALFFTTEAKPLGRSNRGNRPSRPGRPDQRPDKPGRCLPRCPRPTSHTRVCAFYGDRYRTFPSECYMERFACRMGQHVPIFTKGGCHGLVMKMKAPPLTESESTLERQY